jgi:hypothetical protein
VIPKEKQIAYDAYQSNIEAFVYATALKQKVITGADSYPFPAEYVSTVPLNLPATVFRFKSAPPEAVIKKILSYADSMGMEKLVSKDNHSYIVRRPTFELVAKLANDCTDRGVSLTGISQAKATILLMPICKFIDAFLATNTHSFKKSDFAFKSGVDTTVMRMELRIETYWHREGYGKDKPAQKTTESAPKRRKIADDEAADLTPYMSGTVPHSTTAVAKPSLNPSSASWGPPQSVPGKRGILFPYFDGMLQPDAGFIRRTIHSRFFRLLGGTMADAREYWDELRDSLSISCTSEAGQVLSHVLMGIDLALQSQVQVFLLFDGNTYLGFTLLGEEFQVQYRGKWYFPRTEEHLREELATLFTHEGAINGLAEAFGKCTFGGETKLYSKDDLKTPEGILDALSGLDISEGETPPEIKEVEAMLKRLNFPGKYRSFSKDNIIWAIDTLLAKTVDLSGELIHIPLKNWTGVGTREYQILGSFGPHSFSLIDPKGDKVKIPRLPADEDYFAKETDGKPTNPRFIVYEKDLRTSISDWKKVKAKGEVQMLFKERAAGSRAQVFKGEELSAIWNCLKVHAAEKRVGEGKEEDTKEEKKAKGKAKEVSDVGPATFSEWL